MLSKAEYWILEFVVEDRRNLTTLAPARLSKLFCRNGHGLDAETLIGTLDSLFRRNLIIAFPRPTDDEDGDQEAAGYVPTRAEVAHEILEQGPRNMRPYYGLTSEGAKLWERLSEPNWDLFSWNAVGFNGEGYFGSPNASLVEAYLQCADVKERIIPGTFQQEMIPDWEATYWKVLPIGHEATFQVPTHERHESKWNDKLLQPTALWYTPPFDLDEDI